MVQLIKPKLTDFGNDQTKEAEVKSQIPKASKNILKSYLTQLDTVCLLDHGLVKQRQKAVLF